MTVVTSSSPFPSPFPSPLLMSPFFTSLHFPLPSPLSFPPFYTPPHLLFLSPPHPPSTSPSLDPQHIFTLEKQEYQREGINMAEVKFQDNKPLLVCKTLLTVEMLMPSC